MQAKRMLILLVAMVVTIPMLLAGCGAEKAATEATTVGETPAARKTKAEEPKVEEWKPLTIKWYIHYDWCQSSGPDDPEKMTIVKWLKENRNVTVDWVSSNGTAAQRLNTMIASNDLPDIITIDRGTDVDRLTKAGQLVALDDYLGKYPNITQKVGDQIIGMLRAEDGKYYQIPNWYIGPGGRGGNAGWVINSKIYKEMGSPKLDTYTELEAYLRDVKGKYPGIIPFESGKDLGAPHLVYSGMGEYRSAEWSGREFWYPEGNVLKSITEDPAWREAVRYNNRLFRDKLMTQDAFTQKGEQVDEKFTNGKFAVTGGWSMENSGLALAEWKKKDPEAGFEAVMPFHKEGLNKDNTFATAHNALGWNVSVITKNAKAPEAVYKLLDWVASDEGQIINTWGMPGKYWDGIDDKGYPKFTKDWETDPEDAKGTHIWGGINWIGNTNFINGIKTQMILALPEDKRDWGTWNQVKVFWKTTWDGTEYANLAPSADSDEGAIFTRVKDIYTSYYAKIIFAKSDAEVDSLIRKCTDELKQAGQEKLLEYQTKKWQANKTKMGLK
jgi:putative aldouronate transport system substrate-binding protein